MREFLFRSLGPWLLAGLSTSVAADAPRFEFHNHFLLNLHHRLYSGARRPAQLTEAERQAWEPALALYRREYLQRHPLFDEQMDAIKQSLRRAPDAVRTPQGLGLPKELEQALGLAASLYAEESWPLDRARNARWQAGLEALQRRHGAAIASGLEFQLGQGFPAEPIRVDLVVRTGTFEGAYTTQAPAHAVIATGLPAHAGLHALEVLYHEATHTGPADRVFEAVNAAFRDQGGHDVKNQWHGVQFFIVGAVVREALAQAGLPGYVSYGELQGVFARAWPGLPQRLESLWFQGRQQGRSVEALASALVASVPAD
ncbi:MAG: hypothetical protein U1E77_18660 [Inhella sp.]